MKALIIKTIVMNEEEINVWIENNLNAEGKEAILKGEKIEIRRTPTSLTTYEIEKTEE